MKAMLITAVLTGAVGGCLAFFLMWAFLYHFADLILCIFVLLAVIGLLSLLAGPRPQ